MSTLTWHVKRTCWLNEAVRHVAGRLSIQIKTLPVGRRGVDRLMQQAGPQAAPGQGTRWWTVQSNQVVAWNCFSLPQATAVTVCKVTLRCAPAPLIWPELGSRVAHRPVSCHHEVCLQLHTLRRVLSDPFGHHNVHAGAALRLLEVDDPVAEFDDAGVWQAVKQHLMDV